MVAMFRHVTVAVSILALVGCTTLRPLASSSPDAIQHAVAPGDRIRVTTDRGEVYALTVVRVEDSAIVGQASSGKVYRVEYAAIRGIEVPRLDAGKTFWQTLGTLGAALIATVVVVGVMIADDLHDDE